MRQLAIIIFLSGCMFAQSTSPEQSSAPPPSSTPQGIPVDQANAAKARALLDRMIQALGGQAYLQAQDLTQQGRGYTFFHGQPNSAGTLFWRFYKYPDKERIELTKQRDVVYVYNGDKGYEVTYKGTAAEDPKLLAEYLRRRAHSLDWVIRKWLNEPGIALFYDGSAIAAEKPADQVTIMRQDDSVTIYIDTNTHLPLKKSYSWRDPTDKLRNTEDEVYDNYRLV